MGKSQDLITLLFHITKEIKLKNTKENQYTEIQVKAYNLYLGRIAKLRLDTVAQYVSLQTTSL